MCTSQRPSTQLRCPCNTSCWCLYIFSARLSKIAMQLSSHCWPIDSNDKLLRQLRIFACFEPFDNNGFIGSWPLDVDCKFVPFGSFTCSPLVNVVGF